MRYIGNKTKLLGFIETKLEAREITGDGLTAVDPFSGTASVGQHLKRLGFRVTASDIIHLDREWGGPTLLRHPMIPSSCRLSRSVCRRGAGEAAQKHTCSAESAIMAATQNAA